MEKNNATLQVSRALQSGRRLTSLDIWREFGSSRASAIIFRLRKQGLPILTNMETVATRYGDKTVAVYYIVQQPKEKKGLFGRTLELFNG